MSLGLLDLSNSGPDSGRAPFEGVGVLRRGLARLIDLTVLAGVTIVVAALAFLFAFLWVGVFGPPGYAAIEQLLDAAGTGGQAPGSLVDGVLALGAVIVAVTAVHSFSEGIHGSTIGKRLCGITVVSEDGSPAGLGAGLKRSVGFLVDQLVFGLLGAHRIHESPRAQRIGDEWADTMVVRIADLPAGSRRSAGRFVAATLTSLAAGGLVVFLATSAWIGHHAKLSAQDRVAILAAVQDPPGPFREGETVTFAVRAEHILGSARVGRLRLFVLDEGSSPSTEHTIIEGWGLTTLEATVKIPEYRPGFSQPGVIRLGVALLPAHNVHSPSAENVFDVKIVPCGVMAEGDTAGQLCTG